MAVGVVLTTDAAADEPLVAVGGVLQPDRSTHKPADRNARTMSCMRAVWRVIGAKRVIHRTGKAYGLASSWLREATKGKRAFRETRINIQERVLSLNTLA